MDPNLIWTKDLARSARGKVAWEACQPFALKDIGREQISKHPQLLSFLLILHFVIGYCVSPFVPLIALASISSRIVRVLVTIPLVIRQ